jgi:hypothetical protein
VIAVPWHVEQDHTGCPDGWAVVKDDDGTLAGCHDTEAEALDQVQALYVAEQTDDQMTADGGDPFAGMDEVPAYGVLVVEGVETGDSPRREFAPGSLTWASPPLSLKWQPAESEGHTGSVVVGRIDHIWRDGANLRWTGAMDNVGEQGREAIRLRRGDFIRNVSIMADDIDQDDVEMIFPEGRDPDAADMFGMAEPAKLRFVAGRIRSTTIVPEAAFVEGTLELGVSPFPPPAEAGQVVEQAEETVDEELPPEAVTAAAYTITIPEVWPEWWFDKPADKPPFGALHITPQGRVYGYLGPSQVAHRAFRAAGRTVTIPRGVDYSEFQNKPCLVAGADGNVYRINAGNITFNCGHPSPYDQRRADPSWAMQHYDNSCTVAARVRVGEDEHGTWVAGGLLHGITPDVVERMMGCALSGDWQGGKLNAALLVPVEGFPVAAAASVRIREDTLVSSTVPVVYDAPPPPDPDVDLSEVFDLIASAVGHDEDSRWRRVLADAGRPAADADRWRQALADAGRG